MTIALTPLTNVPAADVEALLDAAFGLDRHGRTAYRLRQGTTAIPELSFAAWIGERLVGTLQSWPIDLVTATGTDALVMVGPVAIIPDLQGTGIGRALMAAMLTAADRNGADALMMIGDPDYYGRFGFTAEATAGWRIDGAYERHRLLALLRQPVARDGDLRAVAMAHVPV